MDEILLPELIGETSSAELLLATVYAVDSVGIRLIFDGQTAASQKKYRVLQTGAVIYAGDRVVVMKQSGTYVVLGAIKPGRGLWSASAITDVLTASSIFTVTSGSFAKCGNLACLNVTGKWTEAKSTSAEYTAFTMKSGYRPFVTCAARAWRNSSAILYYTGDMKYYGTFAQNDGYTFLCTYLML